MSSSNSPCAACKFLRRKCTQECVFAPYFPPDNPQRFLYVHRVFGASNVAKLLNELSASQRDDAVKSLAYEAEARLRDPVYGCVGLISILQHRLRQIQGELNNAKKELAAYIGPQALQPTPPVLPPTGLAPQQHLGNQYSSTVYPYNNLSPHLIRDPQPHHHPQQHHQILEAQQFAAAVAAREQQEMFRTYDPQHQQQHQQEFLRFNGGFDVGSLSGGGFNHMSTASAAAEMSPSLALGTFDSPYQIQPQQAEHHHPHSHQLQAQLLLTTPPSPPPQQTQHSQQRHQGRSESEEGRSVGPSSC